jgi:hypothetical protein
MVRAVLLCDTFHPRGPGRPFAETVFQPPQITALSRRRGRPILREFQKKSANFGYGKCLQLQSRSRYSVPGRLS